MGDAGEVPGRIGAGKGKPAAEWLAGRDAAVEARRREEREAEERRRAERKAKGVPPGKL